MSRKYDQIAKEFAAEIAAIPANFPETADACIKGAWLIIGSWCDREKTLNPRFDRDRFIHYVEEHAK